VLSVRSIPTGPAVVAGPPGVDATGVGGGVVTARVVVVPARVATLSTPTPATPARDILLMILLLVPPHHP
jgi:hypothetical protein